MNYVSYDGEVNNEQLSIRCFLFDNRKYLPIVSCVNLNCMSRIARVRLWHQLSRRFKNSRNSRSQPGIFPTLFDARAAES